MSMNDKVRLVMDVMSGRPGATEELRASAVARIITTMIEPEEKYRAESAEQQPLHFAPLTINAVRTSLFGPAPDGGMLALIETVIAARAESAERDRRIKELEDLVLRIDGELIEAQGRYRDIADRLTAAGLAEAEGETGA